MNCTKCECEKCVADSAAANEAWRELEANTIKRCAKVADDEAKDVDGRNADRYWQSRRIAEKILALAAVDARRGGGR